MGSSSFGVRYGAGDAALQRIERLPTDYAGHIYRFDLDKTYLATHFESLRKALRIPFEKAEQKQAIPGMPALLRALRRRLDPDCGQPPGILFISASPPQVGPAVTGKLRLDKVEVDAIVFKDSLRMVLRGELRSLREQVGYKLRELLRGRSVFPEGARELLFGDDWEKDAVAYTLYADALSGRLTAEQVAEAIETAGVRKSWREEILALLETLPRVDAVEGIYINIERGGAMTRFDEYGDLLVPCFNSFQMALSLRARGRLDTQGLLDVSRNLLEEFAYDPVRLRNSFEDLMRRGHLPLASARPLVAPLCEAELMAPLELPDEAEEDSAGIGERVRRPFESVMRWMRALRQSARE